MTNPIAEVWIGGLEHGDFFVRSVMLAVLANEPDPSLEAARVATRQIDLHGWRGAFEFSHQIADLPHSEETVEWAAQRLERLASEEDEKVASEQFHLARWFCKAPLETLNPRIDRFVETVMAAMPPETGTIRSNPVVFKNPKISFSRAVDRLCTAQYSTDKCLAELAEVLDACGKAEQFPSAEIAQLEVLCESLVARGALSEDTIQEWLNLDELNSQREIGPEDYRTGAALLMLARGKTPPPIDPALRLFDLDWDWMNELIAASFVAAGDEATLAALLERYSGLGWTGRLYLTGVFEKLRFPDCEATLAKVLRDEEEDDLRVELADAMALYGTQEALTLAREIALEDPDDPERGNIWDYLCVHGILTGNENDETRQRHKLMAKRHADSQSAESRLASLFSGAGGGLSLAGGGASAVRKKKTANIIPFRPATPKRHPGVGRNDPCPCGSGKKFKKCCGP